MDKNNFDSTPYPQLGPTPIGSSGPSMYFDQPYAYVAPEPDSKADISQPLLNRSTSVSSNKLQQLVLYFVFLIIEYTIVFAFAYKTYLFEYCYWDFGVFHFRKDVDRELSLCNNGGSTDAMYSMLDCKEENEFPECPDLCNLAIDMKYSRFCFESGLLLHIIVSMLGLLIYLFSWSRQRTVIGQKGVSVLQFGTLAIFFCTILAYIASAGLISLREPEESIIEYYEPKELEAEIGTYIVLGLLGYMILYRVLLVVLAK